MLMEGPGSHAATSAQANDKFRGLMNEVNELDSRAKARRRALLTILEDVRAHSPAITSCCTQTSLLRPIMCRTKTSHS
jgi:hypothetical protein